MPKKLSARQRANRMNRAKWKGHSEAGRKRLRASALGNQPWRESTGPRTPGGKAKSRRNALRHGGRAKTLLNPEMLILLESLDGRPGENPLPGPEVLEAAIASFISQGHPASLLRASQLVRRYSAQMCAAVELFETTL